MNIIELAALPNRAHRNQSGASFLPEGYVELPPDYAQYLPFITITTNADGTYCFADNPEARAAALEASAPTLAAVQSAKNAELNADCEAAITAGCDVTLSDGTTGHISLTAEDQINLSTAQAAVQGGAAGYPYHLDGQLCKIYAAADILIMAKAAVVHILYHTTYCNHLRAWAKRATTADELAGITYGATLPDDLKANMEAIISAASA